MPNNTKFEDNIKAKDYIKSLNKITFVGLTGMVALGTSMLIIECNKHITSNRLNDSISEQMSKKTILKSPTSNPLIFQVKSPT